ncbi:MAG: hypothetical protein V8R49_11200 [Duodenibacillus massiliensis]
MPENLRHSLLLLITATIWGTGFVAQALGMEHISPFAFTWGALGDRRDLCVCHTPGL